ncbi:hypothetical protein A0H81_08918 [Grifola frondosa]|uniref:Uncharacterized protein n=1 Tax=Grifola frondosa TaxID=5627 RepID=A0A1C7M3H0_GRIFR|nr:hypothetical protein A0H81_08918 [Grifola frondosa]
MRKPAPTSPSNKGIALSDWLYTMFLFTKSDFKSIVIPTTVFGTMAAPKATVIHVCARLIWVWFNLLQFCVSNQSLSPAEDAANKPWRPIPAHRITVTTARRLRWMLLFVCILLSFYFRIATPGIALAIVIWANNELYFDSHWVTRNACNALGYAAFNSGATYVHCDDRCAPTTIALRAQFVNALIILTTIQSQDFRDSSGDALAGRRTLPLVYPQGSRIAITTLLILWSFFLCIIWGLGILPSIMFLGLGAYVGGRFVKLRSTATNQLSYIYYNVHFSLERGANGDECHPEGEAARFTLIDLRLRICVRWHGKVEVGTEWRDGESQEYTKDVCGAFRRVL